MIDRLFRKVRRRGLVPIKYVYTLHLTSLTIHESHSWYHPSSAANHPSSTSTPAMSVTWKRGSQHMSATRPGRMGLSNTTPLDHTVVQIVTLYQNKANLSFEKKSSTLSLIIAPDLADLTLKRKSSSPTTTPTPPTEDWVTVVGGTVFGTCPLDLEAYAHYVSSEDHPSGRMVLLQLKDKGIHVATLHVILKIIPYPTGGVRLCSAPNKNIMHDSSDDMSTCTGRSSMKSEGSARSAKPASPVVSQSSLQSISQSNSPSSAQLLPTNSSVGTSRATSRAMINTALLSMLDSTLFSSSSVATAPIMVDPVGSKPNVHFSDIVPVNASVNTSVNASGDAQVNASSNPPVNSSASYPGASTVNADDLNFEETVGLEDSSDDDASSVCQSIPSTPKDPLYYIFSLPIATMAPWKQWSLVCQCLFASTPSNAMKATVLLKLIQLGISSNLTCPLIRCSQSQSYISLFQATPSTPPNSAEKPVKPLFEPGCSLLHLAVVANCSDAVSVLLDSGATVIATYQPSTSSVTGYTGGGGGSNGRRGASTVSGSSTSLISNFNSNKFGSNLSKTGKIFNSQTNLSHSATAGVTPLHIAARRGYDLIAHMLLSHDASLATVDMDGDTVLHKAALSGMLPILQLIVTTCKHRSAKSNDSSGHASSLAQSSVLNDILFYINKDNDYGETCLHHCVIANNTEAVPYLLSYRGDINARDNLGVAPFHLACSDGNDEMIKILINSKCDINIKTNDGVTPLHEACLSGKLAVVRHLINNGCEINSLTYCQQLAPLHWAMAGGWVNVVKLLLESGATVTAKDLETLAAHDSLYDINSASSGTQTTQSAVNNIDVMRSLLVSALDKQSKGGQLSSKVTSSTKESFKSIALNSCNSVQSESPSPELVGGDVGAMEEEVEAITRSSLPFNKAESLRTSPVVMEDAWRSVVNVTPVNQRQPLTAVDSDLESDATSDGDGDIGNDTHSPETPISSPASADPSITSPKATPAPRTNKSLNRACGRVCEGPSCSLS